MQHDVVPGWGGTLQAEVPQALAKAGNCLFSFSQAEVTAGKIKPEDGISKPFILLG